jgi:hypothetical protein
MIDLVLLVYLCRRGFLPLLSLWRVDILYLFDDMVCVLIFELVLLHEFLYVLQLAGLLVINHRPLLLLLQELSEVVLSAALEVAHYRVLRSYIPFVLPL